MRLSNPARAAKCWAADDPRGGAALDDAGGVRDDRARVEDAAARLHHHEPPADPGPFYLGDHRADIAFDRRTDVGVDDGGGCAFVLELLGQHVDREGDERAGVRFAEDLARPPFVVRVREGVEVADRDRLDAGGPDPFRPRPHPGLVEGAEHFAAWPGPFVDLEADLARHERRRALVEGFVEVRHPHPPQLEHVAEPAGGEEGGRGALALEDCVGRDRAAALRARRAATRVRRGGSAPPRSPRPRSSPASTGACASRAVRPESTRPRP